MKKLITTLLTGALTLGGCSAVIPTPKEPMESERSGETYKYLGNGYIVEASGEEALKYLVVFYAQRNHNNSVTPEYLLKACIDADTDGNKRITRQEVENQLNKFYKEIK